MGDLRRRVRASALVYARHPIEGFWTLCALGCPPRVTPVTDNLHHDKTDPDDLQDEADAVEEDQNASLRPTRLSA